MVAFSAPWNLISCFKNLKHLFVLLEECKHVLWGYGALAPRLWAREGQISKLYRRERLWWLYSWESNYSFRKSCYLGQIFRVAWNKAGVFNTHTCRVGDVCTCLAWSHIKYIIIFSCFNYRVFPLLSVCCFTTKELKMYGLNLQASSSSVTEITGFSLIVYPTIMTELTPGGFMGDSPLTWESCNWNYLCK